MLSSEKMQWFAMRATYRRGMQIKELLDQKGINSFIPMRYEIHLKNGRRRRELVPVIRDIVFVHTTQTELQRIKYGIPYFQYMMDIRNGEKIIVPDEQMKRFIAVDSFLIKKFFDLHPPALKYIYIFVFQSLTKQYLKLSEEQNSSIYIMFRSFQATKIMRCQFTEHRIHFTYIVSCIISLKA
jgi:hypothetical protein